MRVRFICFIGMLVFWTLSRVYSQPSIPASISLGSPVPGPSVDSLLMAYGDFLDQVLRNHPIAVQADLQTEIGEANLLAAKGGFDPKLKSGFSHEETALIMGWSMKDVEEMIRVYVDVDQVVSAAIARMERKDGDI